MKVIRIGNVIQNRDTDVTTAEKLEENIQKCNSIAQLRPLFPSVQIR